MFRPGRNTLRITGEYTSTIPTLNLFGFGTVGYGITYNDYKYPTGCATAAATLASASTAIRAWQRCRVT